MDFPIELNHCKFIDSLDEVCSTIYHLFKNPKGDFLCSNELGSLLRIHASDVDEIESNIRRTITQIPNLSVISITSKSQDNVNWEVVFSYKATTLVYNLNLSEYFNLD